MRLPKRCAETRPPTPRSRDRLRLWLSQCCILRSSISIDAIDARTDDMKTIFLYKTKQNKTSLCSISSPQPGHIYTTINQYIQSLYNQSNKITNSSKFDTERERERERIIYFARIEFIEQHDNMTATSETTCNQPRRCRRMLTLHFERRVQSTTHSYDDSTHRRQLGYITKTTITTTRWEELNQKNNTKTNNTKSSSIPSSTIGANFECTAAASYRVLPTLHSCCCWRRRHNARRLHCPTAVDSFSSPIDRRASQYALCRSLFSECLNDSHCSSALPSSMESGGPTPPVAPYETMRKKQTNKSNQ